MDSPITLLYILILFIVFACSLGSTIYLILLWNKRTINGVAKHEILYLVIAIMSITSTGVAFRICSIVKAILLKGGVL